MQDGAQELTPELIERLVTHGWERKALEDGVRAGTNCSPSRNTLLYPAFSGGFDGDDDDDEGPTWASAAGAAQNW